MNSTKDTLFIFIDSNSIVSKKDLINTFGGVFLFPKDFGWNWDALWDICTEDIYQEKIIQITIKNLPHILKMIGEKDGEIFLDFLSDWKHFQNEKGYGEVLLISADDI